ncbi:MAG: hypothetical protein P9L92_11125 [Candidatus Electryonea clarkiae]|nr:hypothetical protein [Candidatus Electryonea clarkiae]MDP8285093.1 hypothetical protein [Candidatus Electryonea clarkiae]
MNINKISPESQKTISLNSPIVSKSLYLCLVLILLFAVSLFHGCAGVTNELPIVEDIEDDKQPYKSLEIETIQENQYATIVEKTENIRSCPNGEKIGEVTKGANFLVVERRCNWARIEHLDYDQAWVWAPSLGYDQVNMLNIRFLLGGKNKFRSIDSLVTVLGQPTSIRKYPSDLIEYIYNNVLDNGRKKFGTSRFNELRCLVDIPSRSTIHAEIDLPPFRGTTKELLSSIGMPDTKPSSSDFDVSEYNGIYTGVADLKLYRFMRDFTKFRKVTAEKLAKKLWPRHVKITDRKAELDGGLVIIYLTLENNSSNHTFVGPILDVTLYNSKVRVGKWKLGPRPARLLPDSEVVVSLPLPVDAAALEVSRLDVTAVLVDMTVVPTIPAFQTEEVEEEYSEEYDSEEEAEELP